MTWSECTVVESIPRDGHDLPLSLVVTPEETVSVDDPPPEPEGINWSILAEDDLDEMPVLRELRESR
jgi:5-formyltetrahydrofolate cyclo-ligase